MTESAVGSTPEEQQAAAQTQVVNTLELDRLPDVPPIEAAFGLPGGSMNPVGLDFGTRDLSYEEWATMGHAICGFHRWSTWAIGDWCVWGQDHLPEDAWAQAIESHPGEQYDVAARITGLDPRTVENYASVSRRVPLGVRRADLKHSIHMAVTRLDPADQAIWLARAAENSWTREELRTAITESEQLTSGNGDGGEAPSPVVLPLPPSKDEILDHIWEAAEETGEGGALVPAEVWAEARAVYAPTPEPVEAV